MCSDIGWSEANIASKYLSIMRAILEEKSDKENNCEKSRDNRQEAEMMLIGIFEIMSRSIFEILEGLQHRIENVEKNPLTIDDNLLINNLAVCLSLICSTTASMELSFAMFKADNQRASLLYGHPHGSLTSDIDRTPQDCGHEFLLLRLIPTYIISTLLDVLFINMGKYANNMGKYTNDK